MCGTAFRHFIMCTLHKYGRHVDAAEKGRNVPFLDNREANGAPRSAFYCVNNFCAYLYENLAEPLAENDDIPTDAQEPRGQVLQTKRPPAPLLGF